MGQLMPVPTRPVDDAVIATAWGQEVHDYTFAPAGCKVGGAAVEMLTGGTFRVLPLDTALDDPGGWLNAAADRVDVPTDRAGLYVITVAARTQFGSSADKTRIRLRVNGIQVGLAIEDQSGSTSIPIILSGIVELSAADQVDVWAQQVGSGTRSDVNVETLTLVRVGSELGG
jgi:hypothetical protein